MTIAPITAAVWGLGVLPHVALATTGLTATSIAASMYMPKGAMLPTKNFLFTSLIGLIAIQIGGFWYPALAHTGNYAGLALFSAYNAYDTHKIVQDYENRDLDAMGHSIDYTMNVLNIFVRFSRIAIEKKLQK